MEAGNTLYGFPLRLLRHRGFVVMYPPNDAEDYADMDVWALHSNGTRLIASNPLALLGLLSILDHLGDEWYTKPKIDLSDAPPNHPFPIDLSPDVLAELDDGEVEDSITAFSLLCQMERYEIPAPTNREELVTASRKFMELCAERYRPDE
ncbi:MAG: hypothetical protein Q8O67_30905 [Deltaproteobacteria bacterium]|nr:hypothetical protein [Deltaproteobacteria bacterium]